MTTQHSQSECKKAYNQGCLWGLSGRPVTQCPYEDDTLSQWWESGWEEGNEAWQLKQAGNQAAG
jgi:ribosome modulation factor